MKSLLFVLFVMITLGASAQIENRYFELRIYYAAPGKLDALVKRFTDHTTKLFEKHGMTNIGYWVPTVNDKANALYYVMAYPDKDARKKSWEAFGADPDWKKVVEESQRNGKLVDSVKSIFMTNSSIMSNVKSGSLGNVYELRIYHCFPDKLPNLQTRFKDHTLALFEKHGMANVAYFVSEPKEGKQSDLVYLIAHKSEEEATKSWAAFRADPAWIKAKDASEKDGKIVEKVESVYLLPLSFSKMK
jgi:NIPSNAP